MGLGHVALPFVTVAHDAPGRLVEFDQRCDAFTTNPASRTPGQAWLAAPPAEEARARCESLTLDGIAPTASLLDFWQGAQVRLCSRLFQS